ncbi:collagen-binding protein (plasmid) [Fulvitalea axinellae]|uniref:Collagen-binding protein n=1 Tax=Fulvitalea axinellae TaxID=1182444 RepID=A0AAU9DI70_9BACT|nr:collagen-binding protein [Fulvitalea axinellae]
MKKIFPILLFLLIPMFSFSQKGALLDVSFKDAPIEDFFKELESKTRYKFFYLPEWVQGKKVTYSKRNVSVKTVLSDVLMPMRLSFRFYKDYAVIVAPGQVIGYIPKLEDFVVEVDTLSQKGIALDKRAQRRKRRDLVTIGKVPKDGPIKRKVKVSGSVFDDGTRESLPGATIQVQGLKVATVTDINGTFSFDLMPGRYRFILNMMGYSESELTVIVNNQGEASFPMRQETMSLDEVVVTGDRPEENLKSAKVGVAKISSKTIKELPVFMGEADIVNVVMSLPGVTSVGEGASGINVRGGESDQNLMMQDNAFILNPSHVFGFFSVFNPDLISDVTLFKGMIPARYGGRASSVLDVKLSDGEKAKMEGVGGLGLTTARLALKGPLVKDKLYVVTGVRASYSDYLLRWSKEPSVNDSKAGFYDFNLKLNYVISDKSRLQFAGYRSMDYFNLGGTADYEWTTDSWGLTWKKIFNPDHSLNLSYSYNRYRSGIIDYEDIKSYNYETGIDFMKFKSAFFLNKGKHEIDYGIEGVLYDFQPSTIESAGETDLVAARETFRRRSAEFGAYVHDEFSLTDQLSISAGVRYTSYMFLGGPPEMRNYVAGETKSDASVESVEPIDDFKIDKEYNFLEPRIALNYQLGAYSSVKVGYNRITQNIHQVSNTATPTPVAIWTPSDRYIAPQKADSYTMGYFRNFAENMWETSAEVFYKQIDDYLDYKDFAELTMNDNLETELIAGEAKAYGIELMVKKNRGRLTGQASYTFSRTFKKADGDYAEEVINDGDWYPANFDKPHDFKLMVNYKNTHRSNLSVSFTYSTGRPVSYPVGRYETFNKQQVPLYESRNKFRIPDYHRLDFSYTIKTNHRLNKRWEGSWTFAVYNVYGRKNAFSIYFKDENDAPPQAYKLSVLGTIFPSITYNFRF